jgi:hypothetical protein
MSGFITKSVVTNATAGATPTLVSPHAGAVQLLTLTANATPVFPTAIAGHELVVQLTQDATGSRTVTWPAAVKWAGGTAPTLSTAAGKKDVFIFECFDAATWVGRTVGLDVR